MWVFLVLLVAAFYGCSFFGAYLRQQEFGLDRNPIAELAEYRDATNRQMNDYRGWCEGRVSEQVVQADAIEVAHWRDRLSSYLH